MVLKDQLFSMEQLTVQDVIKRAGGIKLINDTGISSDNKYMVHAEDCIKEQLDWAHVLKLNHLPLLDILEIGTGAGFFPYICREYGHYAESCDDVELGSRWAMGYKLLNIEPKSYYVYKNTSTEGIFEKKFDIITSFRSTIGTTTYIEHPDGTGDSSIDVWDVDEWKFFLKDCSKNLLKSDNSFIYFQCNKGCNLPPYVNMNPDEVSIWGSKKLGEFFLPFQQDQHNIFSITKEQIDNL